MLASPLAICKPPRILISQCIPRTVAPQDHRQRGRDLPSTSHVQARRSAHQYAVAVNSAKHFFTSSIPGASHRTKPVGFDEEPITLTLSDGYGYAKVEIGDRWGTADEYEIVRKLGWGMFATTWLAYSHKSRRYYALKIINEYGTFLEANESAGLGHPRFHEREIMQRTSSPLKPSGRGGKQCLRLVESFLSTRGTAKYLCLVLELAGMDLDTLRTVVGSDNALSPPLVKSIVKQMCVALNYLHTECNVVHTDLKPGNILLGLNSREAKHLAKTALMNEPPETYPPRRVMGETVEACKSQPLPLSFDSTSNISPREMLRWHFKLADFGSAQWLGRRSTNLIQPIRLRAPEVLWEQTWDEKVDIWSLGCLTFEFLTGRSLFAPNDGSLLQDMNEIDNQKLKILALSGSSPKYFNQSSDGMPIGTSTLQAYPKALDKALRRYTNAPINSEAYSKGEREQALAFVARCLTIQPKHRASARDLLRDPWIRYVRAPDRRRSKDDEEPGGVAALDPSEKLGVSEYVDKTSVYDSTFPSIQ